MTQNIQLIVFFLLLTSQVLNVASTPFSDATTVKIISESKWLSERRVFDMWRARFGKVYSTRDQEEKRFLNWMVNAQEMYEHNDGNTIYRKALNEFSDWTFKEFEKVFLSDVSPSLPNAPISKYVGSAPSEWDWRNTGWDPDVRHQGRCASGWAFATAGALEFHYFNQTGSSIQLSVQELVDCSKTHNCRGGSAFFALTYATHNGLLRERQYPYRGVKGECRTRTVQANHPTIKPEAIDFIDASDVDALKVAHALLGPIIIHIRVTSHFLHYKSGVFYDISCNENSATNHALLLVGYGTSPLGGPYWLLKNSWGPDWGENGYIRITQWQRANCGFASFPVIPVMP